jgi:tetratricopeptide (TPR) repeat protein
VAPESPGLADLMHETARACHFNGLPDEAASLCRRALEMAERLGAVRVQVEALITLGILPGQSQEEALSTLTRAIELAESAGLLDQAARAHNNLGVQLNDVQAAREHFLRAAELDRQRGEILWELCCTCSAAYRSLLLGDLAEVEETLPSLRQLRDAAEKPGAAALWLGWLEVMFLRCQGELLSVQRARQGEPEAARRLLADAHQQAAERGELVRWEPYPSWAEANLAMAEGHWPEALAAFEAAVETLDRTKLRWYRARTLVDWAEAYLARGESGDRERAGELLREAEAEFEAMDAPIYAEQVKGRLERLGLDLTS